MDSLNLFSGEDNQDDNPHSPSPDSLSPIPTPQPPHLALHIYPGAEGEGSPLQGGKGGRRGRKALE
jgi:hypothetical protein